MNRLGKQRTNRISLTILAVSALLAAVINAAPSALAKGGGGHGGTPAPTAPIIADYGQVGSLTAQGVYSYIKTSDPKLADTVVQVQTNAPTDLHFLADITASDGILRCNELAAYVYADPVNANVRIFAQGHTGAIWGYREGLAGSCTN